MKKQKEKGKKGASQKKKDETSRAPAPEDEPVDERPAAEAESDVKATDTSNDHVKEDPTSPTVADEKAEEAEEPSAIPAKPSHNRQPSLSLQSRMRSTSFRRQSGPQSATSPTLNGSRSPILDPEGDVTEIYRKQAARLDELEKENKRLAKENRDSEARYKEVEEELEELRDASADVAALKSKASQSASLNEEVTKLKSENTSLQRQNSQLQSQSTRSSSKQQHSASAASPSTDPLEAQLASKSSTIETMELEISNLRAQLQKSSSQSSSHNEQVAALEAKLSRAERAAGTAQRDLLDTKKSLDRASEKAVKDGSERTSTETQIRTLAREVETYKAAAEEATKKVDKLEQKLSTLQTLQKENDGRRLASERDSQDLRRKLAGLENENLKLRDECERMRRKDASSGGDGGGDEELDDLEDEERGRLQSRIRALEAENFELKRGVWRERRREMSMSADGDETVTGPTSPGFDEVDLSGPPSYLSSAGGHRRQSNANRSGFGNVLSAFTGGGDGGGGGGGGGYRDRKDSLFSDDGTDMGFDEDAFRQAQEEESKRRIERVREVKRGLKQWEGWRMDVVDVRMGGGGSGEIFDV